MGGWCAIHEACFIRSYEKRCINWFSKLARAALCNPHLRQNELTTDAKCTSTSNPVVYTFPKPRVVSKTYPHPTPTHRPFPPQTLPILTSLDRRSPAAHSKRSQGDVPLDQGYGRVSYPEFSMIWSSWAISTSKWLCTSLTKRRLFHYMLRAAWPTNKLRIHVAR